MNKQTPHAVVFKHFLFEEGDSFLLETSKYNCILFFTKGRAVMKIPSAEPLIYSTGDIAFFPVSTDFNLSFSTAGEVLQLGFDSSVEVFRELQKILVVEEEASPEERVGRLKIKYPLSFYIMLVIRYIEDGVMTDSLSMSKLSELFTILKNYYNESEIRDLFLPIISSIPDFKLLVYSKYKPSYNVDEFAQACNMRKKTFERNFKEAFNGMPPYKWMQSEKQRRVLQKLSLSGANIGDIISEFNFYDSSHFNKFCKQRFGKTPEELLKQLSQ